ncbi:mitochondrial carrier domain-containing protein [Chaetomidium leptoderma]|uniref:Mitochondrial carrier domain-containing protein n=1 Tax=Chaetomidium leptoderma TaxID=669021 RepID=A0AAN6VYM6_9PEZI|nr:mitochondrial carrier domain-containing protein [Chaetomidium leptoderma]
MSHDEHHISSHGQPAPTSPPEYGVALAASQAAQSQSQSADLSPEGAASATVAVGEAMPDPTRLTVKERWAIRASDSQFNALSGAIGGFTSGIVTCPLDVIKTKLQAQGGFLAHGIRHPRVYKGLVGTASVIWKEEGLRGMYRGLGPIIMGYLPTWAVWFTVYNKSKLFLGEYHKNGFVVNFWSSIIAGASSTVVTNPIWVIKTRLMSQSTSHDRTKFSLFPKGTNTPTSRPTLHQPWHYKSTFDAARKMYTTEGILSFYSGLTPALLGLTHVAVQFPAYEFLKVKFTGRGMGAAPAAGEDDKPHWLGILSASIMSKILASSATYPHEVIRTRLQTQRRPIPGREYMEGLGGVQPGVNGAAQQPQAGPKYKGVVSTFRTMLREEGWRAFYAGMGTNMMRAVPAATVTMLTYEYVMRHLNHTRVHGKEKLQLQQLGQGGFPGA